ncbi:RDD family protein [Prosthecochloris sp.]|uniref:RDD family protein n=1 Tax=Prosthecochloris sp. TaxID=290513 RepID=UPI0025DB12E9|nr:RDD family protein [Prosthecochloris sp.]
MSTPSIHQYREPVKYGGFWIRVAASIIDYIVLLIPSMLFAFLQRELTQAATTEIDQTAQEFSIFLNSVIFNWIYCASLQSSVWQATIGKKIVGLKVVDENGRRISFGRATGRYFASMISAVFFCIGYMMVGWTSRKRGLHDSMAGTFVIYDENTIK